MYTIERLDIRRTFLLILWQATLCAGVIIILVSLLPVQIEAVVFDNMTTTEESISEGEWQVIRPPLYSSADMSFIDSQKGWLVLGQTIGHTEDGGKTWSKQNLNLNNNCLLDVDFVDADCGWICGTEGIILHTCDGGKTWSQLTSPLADNVIAIEFIDKNNGWALDRMTLAHTTDAGKTWTSQFNQYGHRLFFLDVLHGWVVNDSKVLRTTDGGKTWQTFEAPIIFGGISFIDSMNGWLVGYAGKIWRTWDGGVTWNSQTSGTSMCLRDVSFNDQNRGWAVGFANPQNLIQSRGIILRTLDGGKTWLTNAVFSSEGMGNVVVLDETNLYVLGDSGSILKTTDDGGTWEYQSNGLSTEFTTIDFVDENNGWAGGGIGAIIHTKDGGATWIPQESTIDYNIVGISFADALNGWAVARHSWYDTGALLHTSDSGITWTQQILSWNPFYDISAIDAQTAWVSWNGLLLRTTDSGTSWEQVSTDIPWISYVRFFDSLHGWVAGGSNVSHTSDGGITWETSDTGIIYTNLIGADFVNDQVGWIITDFLAVSTDDGGKTWIEHPFPNAPLRGVDFVDELNGWIVGGVFGDSIYHTKDGGNTWTQEASNIEWYPKITQGLTAVKFVSTKYGFAFGAWGAIIRYGLPGKPVDPGQSLLTPIGSIITADGASKQILTVQAKDIDGNDIVTGGDTVTITKTSGTGTVGSVVDRGNGTYIASVTAPQVAGTGSLVATINGQPVKSGTEIQTISTITYVAGVKEKLAFSQQPTSTSVEAIIVPPVSVRIEDANGNLVSDDNATIVTLSIETNPGNALLIGEASRTTINGIATFNNLSIDKPGIEYVLKASSPGLESSTSTPFNIVGPAAKLAFIKQPGISNISCLPFGTQPVVEVQDALGNTVRHSNEAISLIISSGTGSDGAVLSGMTTVEAINGEAIFSNLSIDKVGTDYTLTAICGELNPVLSSPFNVNPAKLVISTTCLSDGDVGIHYFQTLEAKGGASPYKWAITSGIFPAGLLLDESIGIISGKPKSAKTCTFSIQVTDSAEVKATRPFSITINPALIISTTNIPYGYNGVFFTENMTATGGSGKYSWSLKSGDLPEGLNLNTDGRLVGTPVDSGTFNFTLQVSDGICSVYSVKPLNLSIFDPLTVTTISLPDGELKAIYPPQTLEAIGGTPPYKWAKVGTWPAGLTISKIGVISGKPTVKIASPTSYNLTVKVTDSNTAAISLNSLEISKAEAVIPDMNLDMEASIDQNESIANSVNPDSSLNHSATKTFTLTIYPALNITLSGSTKALTALPAADNNSLYTCLLSASGGKAPYVWSKGASFPAWLNLDVSTEALSGTPPTTDIFKVNIIITDDLGYSFTKSPSLKVNKALTITTASLPSADMGAKYKATLKAAGGKTTYDWSMDGVLPQGIVWDAKKGTLSGTPADNTSGIYPLTFQVTDRIAADNMTLSLTINPEMEIDNLTEGTVGEAYSQVLSEITAGGSGGYKFSITAKELKNLPPGLKFTSKTGTISGIPKTAGTYSFNVKVTDSLKGTKTLSITHKIVTSKTDQTINFPDAELEAVIRYTIDKPTGYIYQSELLRLTLLDIEYHNISNLAGLEYCTGLASLFIHDCGIDNISALAYLTNLTSLELNYNNISDISPLSSLVNLKDLELLSNQIVDISPLISLTNLTYLQLGGNPVDDFSPLASLKKLTNLELGDNDISDISFLTSLPDLTYLELGYNQITDISPVHTLSKLTTLFLNNNQIVDISPLASLPNLEVIYLADNNIIDISALAYQLNLSRIVLFNNNISDISALSTNTSLSNGDDIYLKNNPLNETSTNICIPQLQSMGVKIYF
jgi:photosystem II stability/assembly factor-like uncharacterized protein